MAKRICSIEWCDRPSNAGGMCKAHYGRMLRGTDMDRPIAPWGLRDPLERFWPQVDRTAGPDGCWPWTGRISERGYGQFRASWKPSRMVSSHRFAYEALVGPIPSGLELDHVCHSESASCAGGVSCLHRRCCNPAHLEPVTPLENTQRAVRRRVPEAAEETQP